MDFAWMILFAAGFGVTVALLAACAALAEGR